MLPRFSNFREFLRRWVASLSCPGQSRKFVRLELEVLEDRTTPTANFSGTVTGLAYIDYAAVGIYRTSDGVLPGVTVTLTGTTSQGTAVDTTSTTDLNGSYSFLNVLPGTYQLASGPTPNFTGETGGNVTAVSGGDSAPSFTLTPGQTVNQDFGYTGGFGPQNISIRQFLTTTTTADYPFATAGSGQDLANYRPDSAPVVSTPIATQTVPINSAATQIDLAGHFTDPDMTDSEVTFNITNGGVPETLNVTLFDTTTPQTVANFFDYIKAGDYNNAIFSRLVSGFVLQGGGAALNSAGNGLNAVPVINPGVPNEFGTSNTTDTLAMALSSGNINSGTNQFFFNLVDNSSSLDAQKFTVFGELADPTSQETLASLATTTVTDESSSTAASALPAVDLSDLPLTNYSGTSFPTDATSSNYMVINSVTIDKQDEYLTYSATSSNTNLVTASVQNEWLTLNYIAGQTGTAAITVNAVDRYGATVSETFDVTVNPTPPLVTGVTIAPDSTTNATTLTATPSGTDAEGRPITYSYQWLKNGTAIPAATSATLTLASASPAVNDEFVVDVTPSDGTLTGTMFASNVVQLATVNPITLVPPSVSSVSIAPDSATSATVLTATPVNNPDPLGQAITDSYQWLLDNSPIAGATSGTLSLSTVTLAANDQLAVQVTPSDGTLTGTAFTSNAMTVATVSPTTFQLPTVQSVTIAANSASNATSLTAAVSSQDPALFDYQWSQNGAAIAGATSSTLSLSTLTVNKNDTFSVQVTPIEGPLTGTAVTSNTLTITGTNPITTS